MAHVIKRRLPVFSTFIKTLLDDTSAAAARATLGTAIPRSTTAALAAIGNAINTTDKYAGKTLINTTAGTIVTASGPAASDVWLALNGTTAHTPV